MLKRPLHFTLKDDNALKEVWKNSFSDSELQRLQKRTQLLLNCYFDNEANVVSNKVNKADNNVFDYFNLELSKLNIRKYCKYYIPKEYFSVPDSLKCVNILYYHK